MIKKQVEVALLQEKDIDELLVFYNRLYNENRTREKFTWEFFNAPAGKALYVIARDGETGSIIGSQCAIPIELVTAEGTVVLTAKSEDTLVDPNYRGQNIFEKMYQLLFDICRQQGIKYLWGFTSAKKPFLKLGFEIPFDHSQSLLVTNVFEAYRYLSTLNPGNKLPEKLKILSLCFFSALRALKIQQAKLPKHFSVNLSDKNDFYYDNEKTMPGTAGFRIRQHAAYMDWRIAKNPYHKEIFSINFSEGEKAKASLVFNHHKNGAWYLINDNYHEQFSLKQKTVLHRIALKQLCSRKKVSLIRTWDFSHNSFGCEEIALRKKAGYIHLEKGISFVWKKLDETAPLNPADFNLSRLASQGTI